MVWVIEFDERTPIYIQIMDLIKKRIGRGDLKSGDKLPSVREMAEELKVNPNTVQKAYQELEREGIIFTLRGMGSFITQDSEKILDLKKVMVREIIAKFLKDVRELNFSKDEILSLLDKYWKESE